MNPSTTDMNSNFSFNSPSIPRPGLVFTKSRLSKRRGINRPNLKPDTQSAHGVNPFLLGSEYSSLLPSPRPGVDSPMIGESGLTSKDSADNFAKAVLEELGNLKIGINDAASSMNIAKSCLDSKGKVKNPDFLSSVETVCKKENKLIVGCNSGGRGRLACIDLLNAGYENVSNMEGGYSKWVDSGLAGGGEELKTACKFRP